MIRLFFLTTLIFLISCSQTKSGNSKGKVKNVILMIGDGMGPQQISLLYYFAKHSQLKVVKPDEFAFEKLAKLGSLGMSETGPYGAIVADSACSATHLATGEMARSEMIGLNHDGEVKKTILEKAQAKGLLTGLVSDTRMTHATPAAFASHVANRWSEDEIAEHMANIAPDVMLSGGINRFVPEGYTEKIHGAFRIKSRRGDNKNLIAQAQSNNIQIIYTKNELENLSDRKVFGFFTDHNFPNGMWFSKNKNEKTRKIPTLLEMSQAAIKKLEKGPKGFFLMIEGGQIDWAGHRNDAGEMLHEMISFNETLNWVIDYAKDKPDTLLVVTGDHETGSFGFSYNVNDLPKGIALKGSAFKDKVFKPYLNYADYKILDQLYNQKMSFMDLWIKFNKLPKSEQNSKSLIIMVEQATGFNLSYDDAKKILAWTQNKYFQKEHPVLNKGKVPHVHDFSSFYFEEINMRTALIARALSAQQNIVWGTGGHTATAVPLYSMGPKEYTKRLSGHLHHAKVGKILQEALGL